MEPIIKVCGIRDPGEALGAVEAGANAIGMLIGVTHLAADRITPDIGKRIVSSLPREVKTVMVTHLLDPEEVADIASYTGASAVQVHGDMPVSGLRVLRRLAPDKEIIKAVHVTGDEAVFKAREYETAAGMLVLDSRTEDKLGGTGVTHDWSISRQIVETVRVPVILAGGLTPENVAAAIEQVRPAGIDANSGLEHGDGSKDFDKVRAFARAAQLLRY